jgi:hypothetical protein
MKRHKQIVGTMAVAFALAALPVVTFAQQSRPSNGAETTGSAVPRGGGGGGGGGGASSSGGGSGMSGGSSMGSSSSPSAPSSSGGSMSAPDRSQSRVPRRGGGESTGRAVPRGGSAGGSDTGSVTSRTSGASGAESDAPQRRAVPAYSRPRGDRPVTGEAVPRTGAPGGGGGGVPIYPGYPWYPYNPWGWGLGFGYGTGYFYDPFWYGGGGYYGGGGGGYSQAYRDTGSLRLKIKPREAQVFVDGYFVGDVDSFDGAFQRLNIDAGGHRVELKADGYEPLEFEVLITPGETVTYKGEMKRIR